MPSEDHWSLEVKEAIKDEAFQTQLLTRLRKLIPYKITYQNEKLRANFKKEYQVEWTKVEQLLTLVMLYHSNTLEEARRQLNATQESETAALEEKLKLMGVQVNDVLSWMQSRLQGEIEFQIMLTDILEESQAQVNKAVERIEARRREEETKAKEEEKQAAEVAKPAEVKKQATVVSSEKAVKKSKRKNVKKTAPVPKAADLVKMKKEMDKKKLTSKEPTQEAPKKEEANQEEPVEPQIKYLQLSPSELKDLKHKIYMKVYEDFLQLYQGN